MATIATSTELDVIGKYRELVKVSMEDGMKKPQIDIYANTTQEYLNKVRFKKKFLRLWGHNGTVLNEKHYYYPRISANEVATWSIQKAEVQAWTVDNTASTPFIDGMLSKRAKYTKAGLVAKILEKATVYAATLGALTGEKQQKEDELGE